MQMLLGRQRVLTQRRAQQRQVRMKRRVQRRWVRTQRRALQRVRMQRVRMQGAQTGPLKERTLPPRELGEQTARLREQLVMTTSPPGWEEGEEGKLKRARNLQG